MGKNEGVPEAFAVKGRYVDKASFEPIFLFFLKEITLNLTFNVSLTFKLQKAAN